MPDVFVAGIGTVPVGEHWDKSLANLSAKAILTALRDAGNIQPDALYAGNLLASSASEQTNLAALVADNVRLTGVEAYTVEAGEASGAAAFRQGYLAVKSGYVSAALVVGVEKYTDVVGPEAEEMAARTADYDFEAVHGQTPAGEAALLMRRYMHEYGAPRSAFGILPRLAHRNAVGNPHAMYRRPLAEETYESAPIIADPLNLYDAAPYADGAAAVLLVGEKDADKLIHAPVQVVASSAAVDALALHDRHDILAFSASSISAGQALSSAGLGWEEIDFFELWDAFSIYGILTIEASGLAPRGDGWRWLEETDISTEGKFPLLTMGGNKARGFPLGATGVYQVAETVEQLRGNAGANQVPGAKTALVQALGGPAANAVTHIFIKFA